MPESLNVPLLNELAPDGFFYGGHYIVEFDPDSLWYETSLTIAALALRQGMKTEYHVFQHRPSEAVDAISRLGVDASMMEREGLLSPWDSYTQTLDYEAEKKTKNHAELNQWESTHAKPLDIKKSGENYAKRTRAGYSTQEKGWLHLDDNTAIFLQYNDEDEFVDIWRTAILPAIRARECPHFLGFAKRVASEAFFAKFEALCDGIIDVKAQEENGKIENFIRVRTLRGKAFDSRWHHLLLGSSGEVRLASASSHGDQRRLAAIMYTDMVGYTALGQRNESLSLALVDEQKKIIRPNLSRHGGREVKTMGDAFLVEFPSALEAVRCAYDIQRVTREFNVSQSEEHRVRLRIGIHLGDVVESQGDISGDAVNLASRIEPLAEEGGVCLTQQVYDQVANKFDLKLLSLGKKELKNIAVPIEIYQMVMPWASPSVEVEHMLEPRRVAVLPFVNLSADPQDEFFADGLTEELIDKLCRARELEVIARTSVMSYKKKEKTAAEIGKELKAGSLVEGSVRKASNRVRVTAQLISSNTEAHLWSSTYDRDLQDIFAVQTDIAERVAEALRVQLLPNEKQAIEKKPTSSKEAHILYLKGRYLWNERTPKSAKLAVEYFERAIEEDPSFALAYIGLADTYTVLSDQGVMKALEAGEKIKGLAEKALEMDPTMAEAHASLANTLAYVFWDLRRAEVEFKRSIDLNPAYPTARQWYGKCLSFAGRYDEAVEQHAKALQLDPFSLIINTNYGEALAEAGRYQEAIEQGLKTVRLDPNFAIGHFEFGIFYLGGQDFAMAEQEFKRTLEIIPEFSAAIALLGYAYGLAGRKEDAERTLLNLKNMASKRYVDPADLGIAEFGLGNYEEAFKQLEEAYKQRSSWLLYFKAFPAFAPLRADARFTQILGKMGLAS